MYCMAERDAVRICGTDGAVLAEVTFPEVERGVVEINHTFVDESLRGQGVAGELLARAASVISASGMLARPTCSYAETWFERHPDRAAILA